MHASAARKAVLVLHRRAGKTTAALNHHIRAATDDEWEAQRIRRHYEANRVELNLPTLTESYITDLLRGRVYWHILPTYTQAERAAWSLLKWYADKVPGREFNESKLRVKFPPTPRNPSGSQIDLIGADKPDSLRGPGLSGVSMDEYGLHPPNIYGEVISKALADHLGYTIFLGTIKGKNQLYKAWKMGQVDPNWFTLWQDVNQSLATEANAVNIMLRQAMHEDRQDILKGLLTQEDYDQEWFLSTEASTRGAYYSKQIAQARRENRIRSVPYDPALPVHDVWDLGKGPNMSVGMFQRVMRELHMIDYEEGAESEGIPAVIAKLQRRPYVWGKHFAPHDIEATELGTGKTRKETAKGLGWEFTTVRDIGLTDGINAGRLAFARLWIDETKCEGFLEAIGQYRRPWNDRLGVFGDEPVHDWASHPADMYRYAAVAEAMMSSERPRTPPPRSPRPRDVGGQGWMR